MSYKTTIEGAGVAFSIDQPLAVQADAAGDALTVSATIAFRTKTPEWLWERLRRIDRLSELEENWDSYGAHPVDIRSIALAKSLLSELAHIETVNPPTITASPAGNVAMCWEYGDRSLDVEIFPDASVGYALLSEDDKTKDREARTRNGADIVLLLTQW